MAGVMEVMARLTGNSSGMVAAFAESSRAAQAFGSTAETANAKAAAAHSAGAEAIRKAAVVAGVAVAGVGLIATDMAADFEKSTMRLVTSGGMTKDTLSTVRDGILEISKQTGYTAGELADGMYLVSAAGYNTAKGLDILKAAAQGAAAEGTDLGVMTSSLTTIMSTYHLKEDQVIGTTNQLVAASGLAKGTMQQFAGSLSTVLPVAAQAGISFADVSAAIAVMTNKGTTAEQATQELRNAITNLQAPNQVAVKMMGQLGISSQEVSGMLGERGLAGTMKYLTEKVLSSSEEGKILLGTWKQSTTAGAALNQMVQSMSGDLQTWSKQLIAGKITAGEYQNAISTLDVRQQDLGQEFLRTVKASSGFSDALKQGTPASKTYVEVMEKMLGGHTGLQVALQLGGESMGAYEQNIKTITDAATKNTTEVYTNADSQSTLAAQLARTKAEFGAMMIQLGDGLIPMFKDLAGGLVDTIHWFQEHEGAAKAIGFALTALTGFLGGYAIAQWAANSALLAFPGTWIALAVIALGAAFIAAYENIGWFHDAVDTSFRQIGEFFTEMGKNWETATGQVTGFIGDVSRNLGDFARTTNEWADGMRANWDRSAADVSKFTTDTWGMFTDFNTNTAGMFNDFIKNTDNWNTQTKGMFDDFWQHVSDGWNGFWSDPIGETENFFKTTNDGLDGWSKDTSAKFHTWWDEQRTQFDSWSTDVNKTVNTWITDTKTGFENWDRDTTTTITSWVTNSKGEIDTFNRDTNTAFSNWWKDISTGFTNWGNDLNQTVTHTDDISEQDIRDFNATTNNMFATWWNDIRNGFQGWSQDVQNGYEGWKSSLHGKTLDFVNNTEGMFRDFNNNTKGMFSDLGTHLQNVWNWIQNAGQGVADWYNSTIQPAINTAATNIGQSFENLKNWAAGAWGALQEIARAPVSFVINTVYNNGIRSMWNPIADTFGLAHLPEAHFADGGVVRGYHDGGIMSGYTPGVDDRLIAVGGGEAIMRPEWTRAVGVAQINAMNALARSGDQATIRKMVNGGGGVDGRFADGGVFDAAPFRSQLATGPGNGNRFGEFILSLPGKLLDVLVAKFQAAMAALAVGPGQSGMWKGGPSGLGNPLPGAIITQWYHSAHNGIDMAKPYGTPIMAAGDGRVSFSGWSNYGGGNEIHIDHPNGLQTWYAHMESKNVGVGADVRGGNYIGGVGATGLATGPHLHFMVLDGGWPNHMNPAPFIGLKNGGIAPSFDRGGVLGRGLNVVNNETGNAEPLTPLNSELADKIAQAITDAMTGASFTFDTDGITRHVAGKLVLASQRRAGVA